MANFLRIFTTLIVVLGFCSEASAFSRKPSCTVRFHLEVDAKAGDPFSRPVKLLNPPRQIFVESSSALSEQQMEAVYIHQVGRDNYAALFKLNTSGRKILSQISSSNRGRCFVIFVGDQKLARQLPGDLLIDEIVQDGLLPIPYGLKPQEALLLQKTFKPLLPAGKTPVPVR